MLAFGLACLTACGGETGGGSSESADEERRNVVLRIDPDNSEILEELSLGPDPFELREAAGQVWAQTFGDGSLVRIDPATNTSHPVDIDDVAGFAVDGSDVWVAHEGRTFSVLDGATGNTKRSIEIAVEPVFAAGDAGFPVVGSGSVWLTVPKLGQEDASQELWRIDQQSGEVQRRLPIGPEPNPPYFDGRYVWVITPDALYRVDPSTNQVRSIDVANGPFGITSGAGSLWLGHDFPKVVWRIDPDSAERIAEIQVGETVRGLTFGADRVWVTTGTGVVSIDPANDQVGRKIELTGPSADEGPIGVLYLDGSLWVSVE
jgi:hypothetical protein